MAADYTVFVLLGRRILTQMTMVQFERCVQLVLVVSALGLLF